MAVFQMIFKSKTNFKQKIKEFLIESTATQLDENEVIENFEETFSLKYTKKLSNNKYIIGFTLDLSRAEEQASLQLNYGDIFLTNDDIDNVFVYKKAETALFEEINLIEQNLREVLTYIFIQQYPDDIYNLLKEIEVRPTKDSPKKESDFINNAENQFFYLLFTDYINLSELKPIKEKDLIGYIKDSSEYNSLRNNLLNRGITNERHRDFILSLKEIMQPIEEIRNCIAHNRSISDKILNNFMETKNLFSDRVKEFWGSENLKT